MTAFLYSETFKSTLEGFYVSWHCSWLEGYGSPPRGHNGTIDSHGRLTFSVGDPKQLVREQLPDLLRLSTDCPFEDVRERCAALLLDLQVWIYALHQNCNDWHQLLNMNYFFWKDWLTYRTQMALYISLYKKLSCHRETVQRFVSLNILLCHSRSFEMTLCV